MHHTSPCDLAEVIGGNFVGVVQGIAPFGVVQGILPFGVVQGFAPVGVVQGILPVHYQ
jgi:hypothetical protein